jgi:hypothetical protein
LCSKVCPKCISGAWCQNIRKIVLIDFLYLKQNHHQHNRYNRHQSFPLRYNFRLYCYLHSMVNTTIGYIFVRNSQLLSAEMQGRTDIKKPLRHSIQKFFKISQKPLFGTFCMGDYKNPAEIAALPQWPVRSCSNASLNDFKKLHYLRASLRDEAVTLQSANNTYDSLWAATI